MFCTLLQDEGVSGELHPWGSDAQGMALILQAFPAAMLTVSAVGKHCRHSMASPAVPCRVVMEIMVCTMASLAFAAPQGVFAS